MLQLLDFQFSLWISLYGHLLCSLQTLRAASLHPSRGWSIGGPASLEWEDWLKKKLTSDKIKHRVCMKDQFRTDNNLKTKTVNHAKLLNCNPKK